jgi:hypothetical protein
VKSITYVYPLLPYYTTTSEYLNIVSRQIAKAKSFPPHTNIV